MSFYIVQRVVANYIEADMKKTTASYEVIYVSTIAPGVPVSAVAAIAGKARRFNAENNITGLLIFDGMRFCQQLEGAQKEVLALMERIREDSRHDKVEIFHHGPLAERRFRNFSLAFTSVEDVEVLGRLELMDGQPAIDAFVELLTTLDMHV